MFNFVYLYLFCLFVDFSIDNYSLAIVLWIDVIMSSVMNTPCLGDQECPFLHPLP